VALNSTSSGREIAVRVIENRRFNEMIIALNTDDTMLLQTIECCQYIKATGNTVEITVGWTNNVISHTK